MPIGIRQAIAIALGYTGSLPVNWAKRDPGFVTGISDDLSDGFLDGYTSSPALDGRPPQIGFRRPQQSERVKRDCLTNGTNFCFGDSSNYCSSCGTCCLAASDNNNKWCCPSGSICCGNACCGSGQTCNNGKCYLPVVTVTAISSVATTTTQVVTSIATIFKSVIESSVVYSTVEVTITNAETQTNWDYITATTVGKRAILAPTSTASETVLAAKFPVILPAKSLTPDHTRTVAETAGIETVQARQAEPDASTLVAVQSTSTIYQASTGVVTVTSTAVSTTTALKTSTTYQTLFQTNTVVLNAKTTVKATSTWTITSHFPVTLTVTAVATDAPTETSSTAAPALITNVASGKKKSSVSLSTGAIAGIAIAATFVGVALCVMLFFVWLRHQKQKREREAITEDYAYLGTGRSHGFDTAQARRSNSGNGSGGNSPPLLYRNTYSGPPTNSARMNSVRKSSVAMAQVDSNERGLPPTPWYTTKDNPNPNINARPSPRISLSTSLATSPISPTASAQPFGHEMNHQLALGRAVHTRSGSAQTMATATSSTVFGGGNNSTRNSMRSNSGKTARLSSGGNPHKRASSSGAGSGITNDTVAVDQYSEEGSKEGVYNLNNLTPTELASTPAPMKETQPDPPSPMLEPRLGPLRIMNAATPVRDSVEELPKIDNESASRPPTTLTTSEP